MKKLFIAIAALALVASAACTKVAPEEKKAEKISFTVANYVPQTKAGEVSFLNEFSDPTKAQFKCKAFMNGAGVQGMQDFFGTTGEIIKWNATAKEWAPSHDYYWPKDAASYVNFFSWYDSSTTAGPAVTNGTMKWENRVIGTGDNIMYADPAWHFQKNTNPATYGLNGVSQGVPTLFHHALAQVEFRAYATKVAVDGLLNWTIELKDIAIGEIYNQGTLELTSTEPAATALNQKGTWNGTPAWTVSGDKGSLSPDDATLTATPTAFLENQSVLPQSLTNVNISFKLYITTNYTAGQTNREIITCSIPLAAGTSDNPGFGTASWALNTKYIYTIKVVPGENRVLFDPAVESEWTTVNVTEKIL